MWHWTCLTSPEVSEWIIRSSSEGPKENIGLQYLCPAQKIRNVLVCVSTPSRGNIHRLCSDGRMNGYMFVWTWTHWTDQSSCLHFMMMLRARRVETRLASQETWLLVVMHGTSLKKHGSLLCLCLGFHKKTCLFFCASLSRTFAYILLRNFERL